MVLQDILVHLLSSVHRVAKSLNRFLPASPKEATNRALNFGLGQLYTASR